MRASPLIRASSVGLLVLAAIGLAGLTLPSALGVAPARRADIPGTFVEVSERLGISVNPTGERDGWGHGAAFADIDGDGRLELYVAMAGGGLDRLFRYDESLEKFRDVAMLSGCGDTLDGRGVAFADYDNDGDADLFVANDRGANKLYKNDGNGSFVDASVAAGVAYGGRSHSVAWADYNNDGFVDLFVCSYGTASEPIPSLLYRNNGDGTFAEVGSAAGVDQDRKPALAAVWIDYDNDNDVDLYVANDKERGNTMFSNNGDGTFTDVSEASGTRLYMNAMGIAVGDYDQNGYTDMYITNTQEGNALLRNNGDATFTDMAATLGVSANRYGWGTEFLDYDNDGDDDLYVVNWAIYGGSGAANIFYRNDGGVFVDVTQELGVGDTGPGYALTVGDYNDDGFVDMFVNNQSEDGTFRSVLYEAVPTANHWLKIKTVGTVSNRDGIGAEIRVTASGLTQMKEARAGSSYLSQSSPEVEFGLAGAVAARIEVTWPSGTVDVHDNVASNRSFEAHEGGALIPVVRITLFEGAGLSDGSVELRWDVSSDAGVDGFRVYRSDGGGEVLLNDDALIAAGERRYVDGTVEPGAAYTYRLAVVLEGGTEKGSQTIGVTAPVLETSLGQNFPNPFNPETTIPFALTSEQTVELVVYDVRGEHVVTLVAGSRPAGVQSVDWDGTNAKGDMVASGVYVYQLKTSQGTLRRKLVVTR